MGGGFLWGFNGFILLGTGMYEPLGKNDPLIEARRFIGQMRSTRPFKKKIMHQVRDDSTFYKGPLQGISGKYGGFWFCTGTGTNLTRGVEYLDLVNASTNISLLPQQPISKTLMTTIQSVIVNRVPPEPLILTSIPVPTRNAYLDRMVGSIGNKKGDAFVSMYILPHQLNETLVDNMIREMRDSRHVVGISYRQEWITDALYGYRVKIHLVK